MLDTGVLLRLVVADGVPVFEDALLLLRLDLDVTFRLVERCGRDAVLDTLLGFFLDILLLLLLVVLELVLLTVFEFDDGFFEALIVLDDVLFPFLGVVLEVFFVDFFLLSLDCFVVLTVAVALGVEGLLFAEFPLLVFDNVTIVLFFEVVTLAGAALALNG